jgi:transposase, IS30 family
MPGSHLTSSERGQIEALHAHGLGLNAIARQLNRWPSTIGRELARNSQGKRYESALADKRYRQRRQACRPRYRLDYAPLRAYVKDKIGHQGWTPELVSRRLRLDFPDDPRMRVSHETLYCAIYGDPSLRYLIAMLPQARPKRRRRGQGKHRRGPRIPNRVGIERRPIQVEQRKELGHWEGDTIVGNNQDGFLVTLVERSSRLLLAVKTETKNAAEVAQAAVDALLDMPVSWVKTITFDNGSEFAKHEDIAKVLGVDIYFADPYASYQRGTNEHVNGLIRRYLPKRSSFKSLSQRSVNTITELINNMPRICLGDRTPNEIFQLQRKNLLVALRS